MQSTDIKSCVIATYDRNEKEIQCYLKTNCLEEKNNLFRFLLSNQLMPYMCFLQILSMGVHVSVAYAICIFLPSNIFQRDLLSAHH